MEFVLPIVCILVLSYIARAMVSGSSESSKKESYLVKKKYVIINVITYLSMASYAIYYNFW